VLDHVGVDAQSLINEGHTMSGEETGAEKKQSQDVRQLRAWYRAVGLSEDAIAELMRETAVDENAHPTTRHPRLPP
jgi:hypothetical protein